MSVNIKNKEQEILAAAEHEFLDKGFLRAKTKDIAKRAGVTHAMLHYYFRTKENLFDVIFENKIGIISNSFLVVIDSNSSFFDKIREFMGQHFDFIRKNPKIIPFVYSEVLNSEERKKILMKRLLERLKTSIHKAQMAIDKEVKKGTIHPINSLDLILNMVSLNIITFLAVPIINVIGNKALIDMEKYYNERKENNIKFIINSITM